MYVGYVCITIDYLCLLARRMTRPFSPRTPTHGVDVRSEDTAQLGPVGPEAAKGLLAWPALWAQRGTPAEGQVPQLAGSPKRVGMVKYCGDGDSDGECESEHA